MQFSRTWDFNPGNKILTLNDMREDDEVAAIIDELVGESPVLVDGLVAGATLTVYYGDGWPDRPTDRLDIVVVWTGSDDNDPPSGAFIGVDKWDRVVS
jgi:hypothetical protein